MLVFLFLFLMCSVTLLISLSHSYDALVLTSLVHQVGGGERKASCGELRRWRRRHSRRRGAHDAGQRLSNLTCNSLSKHRRSYQNLTDEPCEEKRRFT